MPFLREPRWRRWTFVLNLFPIASYSTCLSGSMFFFNITHQSYHISVPTLYCQFKAIRIHLRKEPNLFACCNTSSTGLALRGPQWLTSLSVKRIDWQTSQRGRHKKWMAVLFYSPCPGIIIQGALGVSTGCRRSVMRNLSQSATLFLRGKCIRRRMMSNTDRVLHLRSDNSTGHDPTAQHRTTDHDCAGILSHESNLSRG